MKEFEKAPEKEDGTDRTDRTDRIDRTDRERSEEARPFLGHPLRENFNLQYNKISFYVVLTFLMIFVIYKVGNNLRPILITLGQGAHYVGVILTPLAAGFVLAYLLYPLVGAVERQIGRLPFLKKRGKSARGPAIALTFLSVGILLILILSLVLSAIGHEITVVSIDSITDTLSSFANSLREVYTAMSQWLENMNISSKALADVAQNLTDWVGNLATNAGNALRNSLTNLTGLFTNGIFAIIFAIYFLSDIKGLERYWDRVLKAVTGKRLYRGIHRLIDDADRVFSGYIRGQLIDAVIMFALVSAALSLLNVKFSVIIGVLTGIGNLIPYVGPVIAYGCTALACLLTGDLRKLAIAIVVLFVIQTVDGNVINPRLLSSSIHVHPMLVIVALLVGSAVGGVFGMLLAVPVAALIKLWFDRGIEKLSRRRALSQEERISSR